MIFYPGRDKIMDLISSHSNLLLVGTVILACMLVVLQYFSTLVSQYKAKADQEKLVSENAALQRQVTSLLNQNVELLNRVSTLDNKAELLRSIGTTQLLATFYTEELSQPIRQMWLRISLRKEIEYKDIEQLDFALEISFDQYNSKTTRFYISDAGMKRNTNGKSVPVSGYRIISGSLKKKEEDVYTETFAPCQASVKSIVIPITLPDQGSMTAKDFQGNSVIVFLPDLIINIAERIEFIINGWAILSQPIDGAVWLKGSENFTWEFVGNIGHLKRSAASDPRVAPPYSLWPIDLFQGIPVKYDGIPDGNPPFFSATYRKLDEQEKKGMREHLAGADA